METNEQTRWQTIESICCAVLLCCKFYLLASRWGQQIGFDPVPHIKMVMLTDFNGLSSSIYETFYSYHPPLGFLIPNLLTQLGLGVIESVQLTSFAISLITFMVLRALMKHLNLLHTPTGIAFLYIAASLPIQIFLQTSLNLDVIIQMWAAIALYLSIIIFWNWEDIDRRPIRGAGLILLLILTLAAAMMTKFSGILLFAIPFLCLIAKKSHFSLFTSHFGLLPVLAVVIIAFAVILPYYVPRYVAETGSLFPNNGDWVDPGGFAAMREVRDADRLGFVVSMLSPNPIRWENVSFRDYLTIRLSDAWRDFWIQDYRTGVSPPSAQSIGILYMLAVPLLLLVGLVSFLQHAREQSSWIHLGMILLLFGLLQWLALAVFCYNNPLPQWGPAKGIYIAPVSWAVAFLCAQVSMMKWMRRKEILVLSILIFTVLNYTLPVY